LTKLRVRDMPRRQQKAVFANMTDDGYLQRLQSAEAYSRKTDFFVKKKSLEEDTEHEIFKVWSDKRLTHRQKMSKIAKIKEKAKKKLQSLQAEKRQSITGEIREIRARKFKEQAELEEVETRRKYCPSCGRKLNKGRCPKCSWRPGKPIWGSGGKGVW